MEQNILKPKTAKEFTKLLKNKPNDQENILLEELSGEMRYQNSLLNEVINHAKKQKAGAESIFVKMWKEKYKKVKKDKIDVPEFATKTLKKIDGVENAVFKNGELVITTEEKTVDFITTSKNKTKNKVTIPSYNLTYFIQREMRGLDEDSFELAENIPKVESVSLCMRIALKDQDKARVLLNPKKELKISNEQLAISSINTNISPYTTQDHRKINDEIYTTNICYGEDSDMMRATLEEGKIMIHIIQTLKTLFTLDDYGSGHCKWQDIMRSNYLMERIGIAQKVGALVKLERYQVNVEDIAIEEEWIFDKMQVVLTKEAKKELEEIDLILKEEKTEIKEIKLKSLIIKINKTETATQIRPARSLISIMLSGNETYEEVECEVEENEVEKYILKKKDITKEELISKLI